MAKEIIPCGGFYVDDETLSFDGKTLKANGSGGGGIYKFEEGSSYSELVEHFENGDLCIGMDYSYYIESLGGEVVGVVICLAPFQNTIEGMTLEGYVGANIYGGDSDVVVLNRNGSVTYELA